METFLLLPTAIRAIEQGGALPAVLNAANEVAVAHFLNHEITFRQIFDTVSQVTEDLSRAAQTHDLEGILSWDREAREVTERMLIRA
jgi:1-deoxy-D-xylulose-5-phosphate reductoisomerase